MVGSSSTVAIGAVVLGLTAMILRAASIHFAPGDDEDEAETVELAGGGGATGMGQNTQGTVAVDMRHGPGTASREAVAVGPAKDGRHSQRKNTADASIVSCAHCGAANEEGQTRCWQCGSKPAPAFDAGAITHDNDHLKTLASSDAYVVRDDESPRDRPVDVPGVPTSGDGIEDDEDDSVGTDEQDIRNEEEFPLRRWFGQFLGWIDKWSKLTSTHMKAILVVVTITTVVWGSSIVYGAARFGSTGLVALIGASIFAVISGATATLCFLAPGEGKTYGLAYPLFLSTLFLPPTVIALYEPAFSGFLEFNTTVANAVANTLLAPIGLETFFRATFELEGGSYLVMWLALSFPVGWVLAGIQLGWTRLLARRGYVDGG